MKKMFTMRRFHAAVVLFSIMSAFMFYAYSTGITGRTKKNGSGCTCHGSAAAGVTVTIAGPETLQVNQTGTYTVTITGGPLAAAGTNIAASTGTLAPGAGLQLMSGELTHTTPKAPSAGAVMFQFSYTAPASAGSITLYANGNSVNLSGGSTGDSWNFAPNKVVTVLLVVPVELSSFTANAFDGGIILAWATATESNNRGFYIERNSGGADWQRIGFVEGNGTSTERKEYSFADRNVSNGAYRYRLTQVDFDGSQHQYYLTGEYTGAVPASFSLEQNFPNPFNPSTTIKFALSEKSNVSLTIYNQLGQKMTTLLNEEREAGYYSFQWNASGLPSGVYLYELQTDNYRSIKKLILTK